MWNKKTGLAAGALLSIAVCTQSVLGQSVSLFSENFESLTLGPIVSFDTELRETEAWTKEGPAGWTVDDSGVGTVGDPNSGVTEFEGWTFVDAQWWTATAGDQDRAQFIGGNGIIAVADPDEWDDFGVPDPESDGFLPVGNNPLGEPYTLNYNARLTTPAINLAGAPSGEDIKISFNSSWRDEDTQKAALIARFNDTAATEHTLLYWDSIATINDEPNPNFKDDAPNESVLIPLTGDFAVPAGATSVELEFSVFDAGNDWWWAFDNLNVFTGDNPPVTGSLKVTVDRGTGSVKIVNETTGQVDLRGYSILSSDGVFDEAAADFLAPADDWLTVTRSDDAANDLSEVNLDFQTIGSGEEIDLGFVRQDYFVEDGDIFFEYLIEGRDTPVVGVVEFVGNDGVTFQRLDLNYDGVIDILDWETFKDGFGKSLVGLTAAQGYNLGDLDGDGRHTVLDFQDFQVGFDAANGAGAFAAIIATPEPAGALLALIGVVGVVTRCSRRASPLLALLAVATFAGTSQAQLKLLEEGFEGLPLADPLEEPTEGDEVVTRTPPAGWTITNDIPGLDDDGPDDPDNPDATTPDGVVDFGGWTFADRAWWVSTAGQDREQFTRAEGTIMVADSDEWDDLPNLVDPAQGTFFNTFIRTPTIDIPNGVPAGRIQLSFDSSWRDEFDDPANQRGDVNVYYDGASTGVNVLAWESNPEGDNFKDDATNERVVIDLQYDGTASTLQLEFAQTMSDNDWWWAIDNVLVSVPSNPLKLRVNTFNGQAFLLGDDVIETEINFFSVESEGGNLSGQATGLSGAGLGPIDGPDPGSTAGDFPGEQWEILSDPETGETQFAEAYLFGQSIFDNVDDNTMVDLGLLMKPGIAEGDRDLTFSYALSTGDIINVPAENVEYFFDDTVGIPGDFNGDGTVDAADYTVWRDGLGTDFTQSDYQVWVNNYGATASTFGVSVPEPTSVAIAALALAMVGLSRRGTPLALLMLCCLVAPAEAVTNDRLYLFGDDNREGAVAGELVGAGNNSNLTVDSAGETNMNQIISLLPAGPNPIARPRYVEVTDRPDGETGLGVSLNAFPAGSAFNRQYLHTGFTEALNFPERSPSSTFSPGGTINYDIISDRGFQLWAKPSQVSGEAHIVMDTNQHGVLINADGEFAMRYAFNQDTINDIATLEGVDPSELSDIFDYSSGVQAVADQWYHLSVVRPFGPSNGSILYVDGVAVAAATGRYNVELVVNDEVTGEPDLSQLDTSPLVVGASTGNPSFGQDSYFSGVVDDLEMFVIGLNSDNVFGEYEFENDNGYAAAFKPTTAGDLDGDDDVDVTDAQLFANGWLTTKELVWTDFRGVENTLVVGDLETRAHGDFNFDGRVDLSDWAILNNANPNMAALAMNAIRFGAVPEPAAVSLVALAVGAGLVSSRRARLGGAE